MSDWSHDLDTALAEGDPEFMKAMLARVPREVLTKAVPYIEVMANTSMQEGNLEEALSYYDRLIGIVADNPEWHARRTEVNLKLDRLDDALEDARRLSQLRPREARSYRLQAEIHEQLRQRPKALVAYRQALALEPEATDVAKRIAFLEEETRKEAALRQLLGATDPEPTQPAAPASPPQLTFDPALFDDPTLPQLDGTMIDGLTRLLRRYSSQQSAKNTLARLDDPVWLAAWDQALGTTKGGRVLARGSELGVFALRCLQHGAAGVVAVEQYPIDGRISAGVVQKNLLMQWHATHGALIATWSEEQRRQSFAAFAADIDIVPAQSEQIQQACADHLIFPNIDHSLLGTGIVKAIREHRKNGLAPDARVLPAAAKVFAMGIEWTYPSTSLQLQSMNEFRWSIQPQPLEATPGAWRAVTGAVCVATIDFERFVESSCEVRLPASDDGNLDAIVYWFELQLGDARLSNAPGGELTCIRPAVQYTDSFAVSRGETLQIDMRLTETRLHFKTNPAATRPRSHGLPSWYFPMLLDRERNEAYRAALEAALRDEPGQTVLDIGAGCGLLSMMAAQAGAARVIGAEVSAALTRAGNDVLAANGCTDTVTLINKDCRNLQVPGDVPERADLAVFELFDCSLIGEGVLHFLAHAREHLLSEHARYLPMAGKIRAMVIEYRLSKIWDIDINLLNPYRFSASFINVDAERIGYRALTEPVDVFEFDFSTATPAAQEIKLDLPALADGTAGAVLFWFELQLDETRKLSNEPHTGGQLHWKQGLQFLPEVQVTCGMRIPILARHDGSGLTYRLDHEQLPGEAFSKLPRVDPRSMAAVAELEQQTRSLLAHCSANPEERAKVADIARRIAIDPAAHDIDPVIAQRFAATFFGA